MQNIHSILVVGRMGQLAQALAALAHGRDLPLIAVARPELDLSNPKSIDRISSVHSPCAIVNAAAYTFVDKAESESDLAFRINCDGAARLALVAERLHVP